MRTTVAIIGGGLAGLYAARLLHAAGIAFELLEARDRLGGRILSVDGTGRASDDGFDLGPSWFWPDTQPGLKKLIDELNLAHFEQHSDGDIVFERSAGSRPQRWQGLRQEPASWRLAGGTAALVRALASQLPPAHMLLGSKVARLTLGNAGVRVDGAGPNGNAFSLEAEHVIAALPPRLVQALLAFEPELDAATARRWRGAATWMAPHAKFFALYERPFWRDAGLSGTAQSMVGPLGEIHDATTASGAPALFGFCGIDARRRAAIGEAALVSACVAQLERLFGAEAGSPSSTLFKDWAADPWTATEADQQATEHPTPSHAPWVTGPWRERLALGGSETSTSMPGYLAGTIDAAERAVAEVMASHAAHAVAHGVATPSG